MPILGICYGYQALNVLYGGKMVQELDNSKDHQFNVRTFVPQEGTRLYEASQGKPFRNACFHHQNITDIPKCLIPNAFDKEDGSIHGLEWHDDSRNILSVLWHPEVFEPYVLDADGESSANLIKYFAKMCIEYKNSKEKK